MSDNYREQVRTGLRLGVGLGLFLIALMLLGTGLRRVVWPGLPYYSPVWTDWVGWLEIGLATMLMVFTAHVWLLLLGGCAVFALLKSTAVLVVGPNVFVRYGQISRPEAALVMGLALATLAFMLRFSKNSPSVPDRFALTFYLIAVAWHGNSPSFAITGMGSGVIALGISWSVDRWRRSSTRRDSDS